MKWCIILPAVPVIVFIYMFVQALLYKTIYQTIPTGAGYRFLHLSDIHIGLLFVSSHRISKTIKKVSPDYIIISGDLLDKPKHLRKLARWLKGLNTDVPIFAVAGNHEYWCFKNCFSFRKKFIDEMKKLNIRFLFNELVFLPSGKPGTQEHASLGMALIGIDDFKTGVVVNNDIFCGLKGKYKCVLAFSHNPDIALHIPENSIDILITGHFHGGQVWMPFSLEYSLLRKDRLCKMGYLKGPATIRKNRIYISRGLGTVLLPLRFFSVPEVTVFDV